MKKNVRLSMAPLFVALLSVAILGSNSANAKVAPETGSLKFIGCTISEEGVVIMVGGRCGPGTHACISNPCY